MSFEVFTYSPTDVYLTLGDYPVAGWLDITIERSGPSFIQRRGIRGKNGRTLNPDTSALITLTLSQFSPSNNILNEIHTLDLQYGTGRIELQLADKSGDSIFKSIEAYILDYPVTRYSDAFEPRVWKIFCQQTDWKLGGNVRPQSDAMQQVLQALGIN